MFSTKFSQQQGQTLDIVEYFACEAINIGIFQVFICLFFSISFFSHFSFFMFVLLLFPFSSSLSSKFISLLALVSVVNCRSFHRSPCSMKMWCPDDMAREGLGWATYQGESMIQLLGVGWARQKTERPRFGLLLFHVVRLLVCLFACFRRMSTRSDVFVDTTTRTSSGHLD